MKLLDSVYKELSYNCIQYVQYYSVPSLQLHKKLAMSITLPLGEKALLPPKKANAIYTTVVRPNSIRLYTTVYSAHMNDT